MNIDRIEILRMNVIEKVAKISELIGGKASSVEVAKAELSKGMAQLGVMIYTTSQTVDRFDNSVCVQTVNRVCNIHDNRDYIEVHSVAEGENASKAVLEAYNNMLLNLFCIAILQETKVNVVKTKEQAVKKAQEIKTTMTPCDERKMQLVKDLQSITTGEMVFKSMLSPVYKKLELLSWNKHDFNAFLFSVMNIESEYDMRKDQCQLVIDYLEEMLRLKRDKETEALRANA